ncbi:MAG: LPS assembly lipoprotein LptE [Vibrio sp.]
MAHLLSRLRVLPLIGLALLTSACGFHLRGDYFLPEEITTMSVTSFDDFSPLTRSVKNELRDHGIKVVPPKKDVPNLNLVSESETDSDTQTTISIFQNSTAAEYVLPYTVQYNISVPGYNHKSFTIHLSRSYLNNPQVALAKSVERDMIWNEMRQDAARQIIRQMAQLKADLAVSPEENNADEMQDFPTEISDEPEVISLGEGVKQTSTIEEVADEAATMTLKDEPSQDTAEDLSSDQQ